MSVRRLAENQPDSFAFNKANAALAEQWIGKYPEGRQQSAVIPLLMIAQEQEGWVTQPAIEYVARMLDMPLIRVLEVATFYTQYQLQPVGTRAHVQVCGTTPCMLRGAGELMDVCRSKIHHEQFHTNEAGTLSWEEVECLGACVNAPMVMIFKDTYEDLTPDRLGEIIDLFEAGKGASVPTGPQVERIFSAPAGGLTALTDEKAVMKATRKRSASGAAAPVAPSNAGKPRTDAPETSPALKSPSAEKVARSREGKASVAAPRHSAANANEVEPLSGTGSKQRSGARAKAEPAGAYKAPELKKGKPAAGKPSADKGRTTAAKPGKPGGKKPN